MPQFEKLGKTYDKVVKEYIRNTAPFQRPEDMKYFVSLLPKKKGIIMDLGSGPGRCSALLQDKGYTVIGLDASKNMVVHAQKQLPSAKFFQADMRYYDYPNGLIGVWASASLQHISHEDTKILLQRLYKVMAQGGVFYATLRYGDSEGIEESEEYGTKIERFISRYKVGTICTWLEDIGFIIDKVFTFKSHYSGRKAIDVPRHLIVFAKKP